MNIACVMSTCTSYVKKELNNNYYNIIIKIKLKGFIFLGQVKIYSFIKFKNDSNFDSKSIRLNFCIDYDDYNFFYIHV